MINSHNTKQLKELEYEIMALEAELDRLNSDNTAMPAAYTLANTNIIVAHFNSVATLEAPRFVQRRQSMRRRLDYLRRRYYALRQQMMYTAAVAFAA